MKKVFSKMWKKAIWLPYCHLINLQREIIPYQKMILRGIEMLELNTGKTIIDAGCGSGNLMYFLKKQDVNVNVFGIDFSSSMLRRASRQSYSGLALMDMENINPEKIQQMTKRKVNAVFFCNVLFGLKDPGRSLKDLAKIMEDDGVMVISTPRSNNIIPIAMEHFRNILQTKSLSLMSRTIRLLPAFFLLFIYNLFFMIESLISKDNFYHENDLEKMLQNAGLQIVEKNTTYSGVNILIKARRIKK